MISIVTPVYNEEDNVIFFHDAVTRVMEETGMAYELIYVDDGLTTVPMNLSAVLRKKTLMYGRLPLHATLDTK